MRYHVMILLATFLVIGFNAIAEDGQDLFTSLRCGMCHKAETGKTTPSLKEIAAAYKGKEDQLLKYLNGEAESVINPEKKEIMKRSIEKTKALSPEERKALADFILDH